MKKRSLFSLSHYHLGSGLFGNLIPLTFFEVLPGDTIQMATSMLVRLTPISAPVMHPMFIRIHHFYVPFIQIWEDTYDFMTGGEDGADNSTPPYLETPDYSNTIYDYLGLSAPDTDGVGNLYPSALPLRAYNHIWNEFYRDVGVVSPTLVPTASGADSTSQHALLRAMWQKDYLTSARPWESLGADVSIPVYGDGDEVIRVANATDGVKTLESENAARYIRTGANWTAQEDIHFASSYAHSKVDVDDLRLGLGLQRFQERLGRHGSRYTEYLQSMGIKPDDQRAGRPVFLGGGRATIQFSETMSTAEGTTKEIGDMAGHGIGAVRTRRFRKFINEHGLIMSIMTIVPKNIYAYASDRFWWKTEKEDFFQPELQGIGDQVVYNKEARVGHATPNGTFGYQRRYSEYMSKRSYTSGDFSTSDAYDWHYARIWGSDPALNETFLKCNPAIRPHYNQTDDVFRFMAAHSIQARRMVSGSERQPVMF